MAQVPVGVGALNGQAAVQGSENSPAGGVCGTHQREKRCDAAKAMGPTETGRNMQTQVPVSIRPGVEPQDGSSMVSGLRAATYSGSQQSQSRPLTPCNPMASQRHLLILRGRGVGKRKRQEKLSSFGPVL